MDKKAAIIATIVGAIGFINVLASQFGFSPLPIDENTVTAVVSFVFIIVGWIGAIWKNWNFTIASKLGQTVTDAIKSGSATEITKAANAVKANAKELANK